jgi:2-polyprenyl-3-methyl-5-hydroxy-6-metoxy-1,4-benzoquinol methylase
MLTNQRYITAEIMDGPNVEADAHALALKGLRRINKASKAAARMARPMIDYARREKLNRLSMLDIACGGGDVPVSVALLAREAGIEIDLTLLDRSATALKLAAATADQAGIASRCIQADLLDQWNDSDFDVVTCSLFLHHVPDPSQVVALLNRMRTISRRMVIISDLRRCRMGLLAAWLGSRILSRSPIVHYDAPASVRAAWTMPELTGFAARVDMTNVRIQRCFPWRMLLIWQAEGRVA